MPYQSPAARVAQPRMLDHIKQPDQIRSAISRRFGEIAILKMRLAAFESGTCSRCENHHTELDDCVACKLVDLCPHCMTAHSCRVVRPE